MSDNNTPEFGPVNYLCGRLAAEGRIEDAVIVGNLWKAYARLRDVIANIRDYGAEPGTAANVMAANGLMPRVPIEHIATKHESEGGSK